MGEEGSEEDCGEGKVESGRNLESEVETDLESQKEKREKRQKQV